MTALWYGGCAVAAGAGAVVLAPVAISAVGFTSAGIAAGSYAAGMMSASAVASGGGVVAGSAVAVAQSVGKIHGAINSLWSRQSCRYFVDNILKCIFLNENAWILLKILL